MTVRFGTFFDKSENFILNFNTAVCIITSLHAKYIVQNAEIKTKTNKSNHFIAQIDVD